MLLAKLGAALLVGLLAGLAYVARQRRPRPAALPPRRRRCPPTGDSSQVYAGVVVSFALLCAFGLGVGAIVRNQVGAIIAAIAFFFILSPLPELLPGSIGDYFPAQAIGSLHGSAEGDDGLSQVSRRPRPRRLGAGPVRARHRPDLPPRRRRLIAALDDLTGYRPVKLAIDARRGGGRWSRGR